MDHLKMVASGNFTRPVPVKLFKRKDEIAVLAQAMNTMQTGIHNIVKDVKKTAHTVIEASQNLAVITEETKTATNEIANAIHQVADSTGKEAKSLDLGARKIQDLAGHIERTTDANVKVNHISQEMNQLSDQGLNMMKTLKHKSHQRWRINCKRPWNSLKPRNKIARVICI